MKKIKAYQLSNHVHGLLMKIERFQGAFESNSKLSPKVINKLKKSTIITSSGSSTRIEGAVLTDKDVQDFINKGCKVTKMSSRSEREVAGYVKALNYIYKHHADLDISEKNIRELHQILTSELSPSQLPKKQRGKYKDITNHVIEKNSDTGEEIVWFKTTPPGPQTASAMTDLIFNFHLLKQEAEIAPIILIASFVVHFLAIHPFRDGNGRLSRLITTWLLLRFSYTWTKFASHEKIIEDNKERYYLALRATQNTFSQNKALYDPWIEFFCNIILQQSKLVDLQIKSESPVSTMNKNEQVVFEIIKTNNECNIGFILEQVEMTRAGLKTLLARLVNGGYIRTKGSRKSTTYYV